VKVTVFSDGQVGVPTKLFVITTEPHASEAVGEFNQVLNCIKSLGESEQMIVVSGGNELNTGG